MRGLKVSRKLSFLCALEVGPVRLRLDKDLGLTVLQDRIVHTLALLDAWQVRTELWLNLSWVENVVTQRLDERNNEGHLGGFLVGETVARLLGSDGQVLQVVDQVHRLSQEYSCHI